MHPEGEGLFEGWLLSRQEHYFCLASLFFAVVAGARFCCSVAAPALLFRFVAGASIVAGWRGTCFFCHRYGVGFVLLSLRVSGFRASVDGRYAPPQLARLS